MSLAKLAQIRKELVEAIPLHNGFWEDLSPKDRSIAYSNDREKFYHTLSITIRGYVDIYQADPDRIHDKRDICYWSWRIENNTVKPINGTKIDLPDSLQKKIIDWYIYTYGANFDTQPFVPIEQRRIR